LVAALCLAAAAACAPLLPDRQGPVQVDAAHAIAVPPAQDALVGRARADLAVFTGWLARNHVKGIISEVGWPAGPDANAWNALADAWYRDADAAKVPVIAWAAGPFSLTDTHQIYAHTVLWPDGGVDRTTPQSGVVEAHPSTRGVLRGVAVTGGSWGDGLNYPMPFSNVQPGQYGATYFYELPSTFRYLASRGLKVVRIDFKWERIQPVLGAPLDPAELARLHSVVDSAEKAGLRVVIDLHNYGAYQTADGRQAIGSAEVPVTAFADVWSRLATSFERDPSIAAYGIMNEPEDVGGPRAWELDSQAAVDAIRATGDGHEIDVSGDNWSHVETWATEHPVAWINDPLGRTRYDAHQYFDADHTADYRYSYAQELALAQAAAH
jgi:hypothetical protein